MGESGSRQATDTADFFGNIDGLDRSTRPAAHADTGSHVSSHGTTALAAAIACHVVNRLRAHGSLRSMMASLVSGPTDASDLLRRDAILGLACEIEGLDLIGARGPNVTPPRLGVATSAIPRYCASRSGETL